MQLSIIIRVYNEAEKLEHTLKSLRAQQTDFEYEIIVMDNESTDGSREIAVEYGCAVYTILKKDFSYGRALNTGIAKSQAPFVMILSAHILLLDKFFLQQVPAFFSDAMVAGLRFTPASDKNASEKNFVYGMQKLQYAEGESFVTDNWNNFIVNHCSAIRKTCWQQLAFDEHMYASEDKLWSLQILKKGQAILYNIPLFYLYTKEVNEYAKMYKLVIDTAAKEKITGIKNMEYSQSVFLKGIGSLLFYIKTWFKKMKAYAAIRKGISTYRNAENNR